MLVSHEPDSFGAEAVTADGARTFEHAYGDRRPRERLSILVHRVDRERSAFAAVRLEPRERHSERNAQSRILVRAPLNVPDRIVAAANGAPPAEHLVCSLAVLRTIALDPYAAPHSRRCEGAI